MKDAYGRNITYLRVSLIDRCNLRCVYCVPHGPVSSFRTEELLTSDEIVRMVRIFARLGITKVRLTGGEPLLRKGVPDLVGRLKGIDGIREVVMTTNGILLAQFAAELKRAGLDRLNVSLDTLDQATFIRIAGQDKLRDVLDGIEAAHAAGIGPMKINTVLMRGYNDSEILDLVSFAAERGMEIRFIEWMPTAGQIYSVREDRYFGVPAARALIESHCTLLPDDAPQGSSPACTYRVAGSASKVGFITPLSNAFCGACNRVRVKANGMFKTCLHGREDLNFLELLRSNISEETIGDLVAESVFGRPKEHFLNDATVSHNDFVMTAVGG